MGCGVIKKSGKKKSYGTGKKASAKRPKKKTR